MSSVFSVSGPTELVEVTDAPSTGFAFTARPSPQVRVYNGGLVVVYVARGDDAAEAEANAVVPTAVDPGATPVPPGAVEVFSAPEGAFWSLVADTGDTADVFLTPGRGI
jgi:hypothetical protein